MAALDNLNYSSTMKGIPWSTIRPLIAELFWQWFHDNYDDKLTIIRFWIIRKTIYVRDLHDVFVILFGPEPRRVNL